MTPTNPLHSSKFAQRGLSALGIAGILLLAVFSVILIRTPWVGYSDFDQIYMAGIAWRKGLSPYDGNLLPLFGVPNGPTNAMLHTYYYSPLCGMLAMPLGLMPFPLAVLLWKVIICGTFLYACWRFMGHLPAFSDTRMRLFLLGLVACAGSVRWCLKQLQPSLFVTGLLILFACFVVERNRRATVICALIIGIKLTFLLPALGLLLIVREYRVMAQIIGISLILNLIALAPTGFAPTLQTYRHALATFEDTGKMTRPDSLDFLTPYLMAQKQSPLAPYAPQDRKPGYWSGEQIHYPFIVSSWGIPYPKSRTIGQVLSLFTLVGCYGLWRKFGRVSTLHNTEVILTQFVALMGISLLIVYHQRYDVVALIPGFLIALALINRSPFRALSACAAAIIFFLCFVLSGSLLDKWHGSIVVPHGWLFLVPICGYMVLTVTLCLFAMAWKALDVTNHKDLVPDVP